MATRFGWGPVFQYDLVTGSRRWQLFAARTLLALSLLVGLALVWVRHSAPSIWTFHAMADLGRKFFTTLMGIELSLVLLVAPSWAVGAFAQEKSRGQLLAMLVTDLSDTEIVLGRIASRLGTVLGIIACAFPVLALATFLGGVDPAGLVAGTLVIVAASALGVCVASTFSIWASRPHEALIATYALWAVWLLAALLFATALPGSWVPDWIMVSNPYWLLFTETPRTAKQIIVQDVRFLAASLGLCTLLAVVSIRSIRTVTTRQASRVPRGPDRSAKGRPAHPWMRRLGLAPPTLDQNPILWREWHRKRPSIWTRATWRLYGTLSALFSAVAIFHTYVAPGINGFAVSIGLLLASVGAATCLAEERSQGSLDVLLATPLSSREIVLAKWWGAFRAVPFIALLPTVVFTMIGLRFVWFSAIGTEMLVKAPIVFALVLAYGMAVASLGVRLGARNARLSRAVAWTVSSYLAATVVWPAILIVLRVHPMVDFLFYGPSPFFGVYFPTSELFWTGQYPSVTGQTALLAMVIATIALLDLAVTIHRFDRDVGRMPERGRSPRDPAREPRPRFALSRLAPRE
jgi:ABC-type transport system involved in multi-copper enzyme maturation permease subunit